MIKGLTPKEKEIYNLILKGFSRKEISKIMKISTSTVCCHTQHIFQKSFVNSNIELLALRIQELEKVIKEIRRRYKMRTEEEIREELAKILEDRQKEKSKIGKIIYGAGINIIRWILGDIEEL